MHCVAVVYVWCVVVAIVMLCAHLRHERYNTTLAWLPCYVDHEKLLFAAAEWLRACHRARVTTWIVGTSRAATFVREPWPLPWMYTLEFAVQEGTPPSRAPDGIVVHTRTPLPPRLESCTLGFVRRILREPRARRSLLHRTVQCVDVPRRDWFDVLRYPWRTTDPYYALVPDYG